jgi:fucose permease
MQRLVERLGRAVTLLIALALVLVTVLTLAEAATGVNMLPGSHETGNQPGAD